MCNPHSSARVVRPGAKSSFLLRAAAITLSAGIASSGCVGPLKPTVRIDPEIEARIATIEKKAETRAGKTQLDNVKEAVVGNQQTALDAIGLLYGDLAAFKDETTKQFRDVGTNIEKHGISDFTLVILTLGPVVINAIGRRFGARR